MSAYDTITPAWNPIGIPEKGADGPESFLYAMSSMTTALTAKMRPSLTPKLSLLIASRFVKRMSSHTTSAAANKNPMMGSVSISVPRSDGALYHKR
jgi:hypothetical protein